MNKYNDGYRDYQKRGGTLSHAEWVNKRDLFAMEQRKAFRWHRRTGRPLSEAENYSLVLKLEKELIL